MKATQLPRDLGQSIWLDHITQDFLWTGTLERYRNEFSLSGLASNPAIFDRANGDCEKPLAKFAKAGIDIDALATRLQDDGARSFVKSWNDLIGVIASKSALLRGPALKAGG